MADRNAAIIVSLRGNADAETRKLANSFRELIQRTRDAGASQEQAERKALAHASALARLAVASGQAAQGERVLSAALSQVDRESTAAIRTQTQLATIQNRGAGLAQQFGGALKSNLLGVLGPAALAVGAFTLLERAISGSIASAQYALELRETRNSLQAVAGDAKVYSQALAVARQQQLLFGGSLKDNIGDMQGLTIVSRESGASLQQLVDLSQRLNLKSPEQGIGGARIAITEALSGNVNSASRRFEIPKEKLKELGDTSLPVAQRLQAIDTYLNQIGITSEAVSGKVDKDAMAFRRLTAELEVLNTGQGDRLATTFGGAADGLARLVGLINGNPKAIAEIRAIFAGQSTISTEDVGRATRDVASSRAAEVTGGQRGSGVVAQRLGGGEELSALRGRLIALQLQDEATGQSALRLTEEWVRNGGEAEVLTRKLIDLANGATGLSSPYSAAAQAAAVVTDAFAKQTVESIQTSLEAERQRRVMELLASVAARVKAGLIIEAQGAAILRGELGAAADEALRLQLQLDGTKAAIDLQKTAPLDASTRAFIAKGKAIEGQAAATKALEDRTRSVGTLTERQALAARKLADARKAFGADSAEAISAETDVIRLRREAEQLADREGKTRIKDGQTALGLEERIADSKEKQLRSAIDARLAIVDDAKQDILDAERLRRNEITARSNKDSNIRRLAALDSDRVPLEDARRALDIREQLATAGGSIVGGRIQQGQRGGGLPDLPGLPGDGGGGLPSLPGLPTGGGTMIFEHHIYLGEEEISARVVTELRGDLNAVRGAGAGRG